MNKEEKVSCLRAEISGKAQSIVFLLKHIIEYSESTAEIQSFAYLAHDEAKRILRMSELIGKILNH